MRARVLTRSVIIKAERGINLGALTWIFPFLSRFLFFCFLFLSPPRRYYRGAAGWRVRGVSSRAGVLSRAARCTYTRRERRVFDTRSIAGDKMNRATYLSRHLFQTTQRNQRRLSDELPLPRIAAYYHMPFFSFRPLTLRRQYLLLFNFLCREKMACRSRLSIQMGLAYRDRADHPLFPRRTTPLPMNNAFSRGNRYADCRSVPTYTFSLSLPSLPPSLSRPSSPSPKSRCSDSGYDLGQWKFHILHGFAIFFPSFYFHSHRASRARTRGDAPAV